MLKVGLTGGIACGKSHVLAELSRLGAETIDADKIAHQVMAPGHDAFDKIVGHFGRQILAPDGTIDRKKLGAIVFTDGEELKRLNAIVHPQVLSEEMLRIEELMLRLAPPWMVVVDAALMIEVGSHTRYDKLIVVYCTPNLQMQRLMSRDGLTVEQALLRISRQMPIAQKVAYADYVIDNSGKWTDTRNQVHHVYLALRAG